MHPYETKTITIVRFVHDKPGVHKCFFTAKTYYVTNETDDNEHRREYISFVLPIEIEVTDTAGLFSNVPVIDFGSIYIPPHSANAPPHSALAHHTHNTFASLFGREHESPTSATRHFDLYLTYNGPNDAVHVQVESNSSIVFVAISTI